MMHRTVFTALALAAAATLAGCAATNANQGPTVAPASAAPAAQSAPQQNDHEARIRARSAAFWEARQRNDVAASYQFTSPSYRKVNDQERFRHHYAGVPVVIGRQVERITCDDPPQRCVVKLGLKVAPPMAQGLVATVYSDETWILEEGEWWVFRP